MINPAKKLPDSIKINGTEYKLNTDFKKWIRFQQQLEAKEVFLPKYLFKDKRPPNYTEEVRNALIEFLIPTSYYPRVKETGKGSDIDFLHDWDYIYASFWRIYGINLTTAQLHYHQYLALFKGLFMDYSQIIDLRNYDGKDKNVIKQKLNWQVSNELEDDSNDEFTNLIEKQYEERKAKQKAGD